MVQVFQVMSHGRRFYRVLEYTSNVKYTLRDMQPSLDDRQRLWPTWERYGAGHPYGGDFLCSLKDKLTFLNHIITVTVHYNEIRFVRSLE
jgi:hypothetical protein